MEYFLHPVSATEAAHIPFPRDLPLDQRDAYMAKPPRAAIEQAARVAHASAIPTPTTETPDGHR